MNTYSETTDNRPGSEAPPRAPIASIPLYVGGLLVLLAGIFAVAYQMADARFTQFTVTLTMVGVATSYALRRIGVPARWLKIGALGLCVVFVYAIQGQGPFGTIVPAEAQVSPDMMLACALALTATFCSFLLVTDDAVIFTCVFTLALIGLIGTVNVNRELILCFLLFLGAAVFLLVHQNYLLNRPRNQDPEVDRAALLRLLPAQVIVTIICGLGAIAIGFMISIPLQMAGRNLSLATIIRRLTVPAGAAAPGLTARLGSLEFNDPQRFEVGLGPVSDDQTVVMSVSGEQSFYWRGRTYEIYSGTGWENSNAMRESRQLIEPETRDARNGNRFVLPAPNEPRTAVRRYTHRFRPATGAVHPLYSPAEPREVVAPLPMIFMRSDRTLGGPRGGLLSTPQDSYDVVSEVTVATPDQLRRSSKAYPGYIRTRYQLQGPSDMATPELEALAAEAVAGATDPYSKAEAIRQFVAERCAYSLEAPAVPRNRDAAEYFLNESRVGYCDLYATAVAILCRYAGLPARVATGFVPGSASDSEPNTWILKGADRHAWAEVYFTGYGWIAFDASSTTHLAPTAEEQAKRNPLVRWWTNVASNPLPFVLLLLGTGGVGFALKTEIWDRMIGHIDRGGASGPAGEVLGIYRGALRPLAKRGLKRTPETTPGAFAERVRAEIGTEAAASFIGITRLLENSLYSLEGPAPQTIAEGKRLALEHAQVLRKLPRTTERKEDAREGATF